MNDMDEYGDVRRQFIPPISYINGEGFVEGVWKGTAINSLQTSHLQNIVAMLERHKNAASMPDLAQAFSTKIAEIQLELNSRKDEVVTRHEFRITAEDIVALAKAKGVKIPKTGAGVYIGPRESQRQVSDVYVRFDTTTKLSVKRKRK